jgi:hypothetical protein
MTLGLVVLASTAHATVPSAFSVQGVLRDNMGQLQTMAMNISVSLFDAQTMGNKLAGPYAMTSVPVSNGLFTFPITDASLQTELAAATQVWLEVTVGSDTFARQPVTPQIYSLMCGTADVANSMPGVSDSNGSLSAFSYVAHDTMSALILVPAGGGNFIESGTLAGTGSAADLNFTSYSATNVWMTIKANGNVGIGTQAPLANLMVNNVAGTTYTRTFETRDGSFSNFFVGHSNGAVNLGSNTSAALAFHTGSDMGVSGTSIPSAERMRIDAAGNVGIGTTTPQSLLDVNGDISSAGVNAIRMAVGNAYLFGFGASTNNTVVIGNGAASGTGSTTQLIVSGNATVNGNIIKVGSGGTNGCVQRADGTGIAGTCPSDARLKKNVVAMSGALDKLTSLQPVTYEWRQKEFPERHFGAGKQTGLIAQEVEKVLPDLVATDEKGYKAVSYGVPLEMLLIQSVKELRAENAALKERLAQVEARLNRRAAR